MDVELYNAAAAAIHAAERALRALAKQRYDSAMDRAIREDLPRSERDGLRARYSADRARIRAEHNVLDVIPW